jgi:CRP-like cAMP-binding protein
VQAWARINNAQEKLVNTFSRGDVFGQVALINTIKRTATVVASSNCELLCLFRDDFEEVRSRFPQFSRALSRVSTLKSGGWLRLRSVLNLAATTRLLAGKALSTKEILGFANEEVAVNKGGVVSTVSIRVDWDRLRVRIIAGEPFGTITG